MKKLFLCLILILSASLLFVPVMANAASADFCDVPDQSWYSAGVNFCNENGYMKGTSDSCFSPNNDMTRAMAVTVLAKLGGANLSLYSSCDYDDVEDDIWYASSVQWAKSTDIVKGTGNNCFTPNRALTREEFAVMIYNFAKANGYNMNFNPTFKFSRYADLDDISSYAYEACNWACANEIMDVCGFDHNLPKLQPKAITSRAQAAVMVMKLATAVSSNDDVGTPKLSFSIDGNDISDYVIVYSDQGTAGVTENAATLLKGYIQQAYGVSLDIVLDTATPVDCEIIVGKTNREDMGLITVDRTSKNDLSYVVNIQGKRLVIAGNIDAKRRYGTRYGVYDFAEDKLGFKFYASCCNQCNPETVNLESTYELRGGPLYKSRVVYWFGEYTDGIHMRDDEYYCTEGHVHNLGEWIDGSPANASTPCLTDEANIQKVIDRVKTAIKNRPETELIWVSINDSDGYCRCPKCRACYEEDESYASTEIRLCNRVCEALEDCYPNVKVLTLAYNYTVTPPKVTKVNKNVIVYYCPVKKCVSHTYGNHSCYVNEGVASDIEKWGELCEELFVWDYSSDFTYCSVFFPDFKNLRQNARWFYENRVRGVFNNALDHENGEFGPLRAFLLSKLYYNPYLTEQEYSDLMDDFLNAYYGEGGKYIRQYIDFMESCDSRAHVFMNAVPHNMFDNARITANQDWLKSLWEKAEALAKDEGELDRIQLSKVSFLYTLQVARFDYRVAIVSDPTYRDDYYETNDLLIELAAKYNVAWRENVVFTPGIANRYRSPQTWGFAY